jgi:hypothetical protein
LIPRDVHERQAELAAERDERALGRDDEASERDVRAGVRDEAADLRDTAARLREDEWIDAMLRIRRRLRSVDWPFGNEDVLPAIERDLDVLDDLRLAARDDRHESLHDRSMAGEDRRDAAGDRAQSGVDRDASLADRHQGELERNQTD